MKIRNKFTLVLLATVCMMGIISFIPIILLNVIKEAGGDADKLEKARQFIVQNYGLVVAITLGGLLLSCIAGILSVKIILRPLRRLRHGIRKIELGDLNHRVFIASKDEFGLLAKSFNKLTEKFQKSILNTEKRIAERTSELQRINRYMSGRELRMRELKNKIKELTKKNENTL